MIWETARVGVQFTVPSALAKDGRVVHLSADGKSLEENGPTCRRQLHAAGVATGDVPKSGSPVVSLTGMERQ